jgi:hypothetical protein
MADHEHSTTAALVLGGIADLDSDGGGCRFSATKSAACPLAGASSPRQAGPMLTTSTTRGATDMTTFLIVHRHAPGECREAHVAWRAVAPWLPDAMPSACADGGHSIWWKVRAWSRRDALELLPEPLRHRAHPVPIS